MIELSVTPARSNQHPAIVFEHTKDITYFHRFRLPDLYFQRQTQTQTEKAAPERAPSRFDSRKMNRGTDGLSQTTMAVLVFSLFAQRPMQR